MRALEIILWLLLYLEIITRFCCFIYVLLRTLLFNLDIEPHDDEGAPPDWRAGGWQNRCHRRTCSTHCRG